MKSDQRSSHELDGFFDRTLVFAPHKAVSFVLGERVGGELRIGVSDCLLAKEILKGKQANGGE